MRIRHPILFLNLVLIILVVAACAPQSAKRQAESVSCGNYMCSICTGARLWAMDNSGYLPSDFVSMSNELATPRILVCPGDESRRPATDWASLTPDQSSYEIVGARVGEGDTNAVFLRCKVHRDHLGYPDGTIFDGNTRRTKIP